MKGLTKAVIASFVMCAIYAAVAIALTVKGYEVNDTLTQYFYLTFGIEFGAAAAIKIAKHITKETETERRIRRIKREGLPVEKADLKEKTGNTYEDYYDEGDDHIYG